MRSTGIYFIQDRVVQKHQRLRIRDPVGAQRLFKSRVLHRALSSSSYLAISAIETCDFSYGAGCRIRALSVTNKHKHYKNP